jgi:hypothetical protein
MRYRIKGIARDSYGNILPNEKISIKLYNSDINAIVYETEESTNPKNEIFTNEFGFFECYFDISNYTNALQLFDFIIGNLKFEKIDPFFTDKEVLNTIDNEHNSIYDRNVENNFDFGTF